MRDFFINLGLEDLFYAYHASYQGLTLEFLSSLYEGINKGGDKAMFFRLKNVCYSATNEQLAEIFGLPTSAPSGRKEDQTLLPLEEVWRWVSGKPLLNYSHLYASDAQHPFFRLFFKFCRECLFACPNSHQIRQTDLFLLSKYLNPNPHCDRYMPSALWKHLFNVSNARGTQPICVGGHVTRIAEAFGLEFEYRPVPESLFDYEHLYRSKYLLARKDDRGPYIWVASSNCSFNLSRNAGNLPPIFPKPEDPNCFLLDGVAVQEHARDDEDVQMTEPPSTSTFREPHVEVPLYQPSQGINSTEPPQWFSTFSSGVMDSLGQLQIETRAIRGEIAQLRERQDQMWEAQRQFYDDQRHGSYPVYDYAYHNGWVRPNAPTPSWYERPPHFHLPHYIFGNPGEGSSGGGGHDLGGSAGGQGGFGFGTSSGGFVGGGGGGDGDDDSGGDPFADLLGDRPTNP